MDETKMKILVEEDEDFIALKRFNFSIKNLLKRYPDGAPTHVIAGALLVSEEELETEYTKVVEKLKKLIL